MTYKRALGPPHPPYSPIPDRSHDPSDVARSPHLCSRSPYRHRSIADHSANAEGDLPRSPESDNLLSG